MLGRGVAAFGEAQQGDGIGHAPQIGDPFIRAELHGLAQAGEPALHGDTAAAGGEIAGDQAQQRRLADAVAADKGGAFALETKV